MLSNGKVGIYPQEYLDLQKETTVQEILGYDPFVKDDFILPKKWCVKVGDNINFSTFKSPLRFDSILRNNNLINVILNQSLTHILVRNPFFQPTTDFKKIKPNSYNIHW